MNNMVRVGLVAAAVVAAAILGFSYLIAPNVGDPTPDADPTPTQEPTTSPISFSRLPGGGTALDPGSYLITYASPVDVTITVPDEPYEDQPSAWYKALPNSGPWHQSNAARLAILLVSDLYADPCRPELGTLSPAVGPTVDDLVSALTTVRGVDSTAPSQATVDGYSGQMLELTAGDQADECADEKLLWEIREGDPGIRAPGPGDVLQIWVLDIEGTRLVIVAAADDGFDDQDALQGLVDSIQIDIQHEP